MITTNTDNELYLKAVGFFVYDGNYSIERQSAVLLNAAPREMHIDGIELCEEYQYWDAKRVLSEIDTLHKMFKEVYEEAFKDAGNPWDKPNVQHIEKPM